MVSSIERVLSDEQVEQFENEGYFVARGLLSAAEVVAFRERFMEIQREALAPETPLRAFYQPQTMDEADGDMLKHFPRIMHPHRFDEASRAMMLNPKVDSILRDFFGEEALAAQSMLYFKPPGARGQALHQDNFYLKVSPGTCIAAWLSLDDADSENGTLFVVPGSHREKVLCPHAADLTRSFTTEEVDIPEGLSAIEVPLQAGDILFFNGSLIHGSYPNTSRERFRRAFICHYVGMATTEMNSGYYPLHTFDGQTLERGHAEGGGVCGTDEWAAYQAGIAAQMEIQEQEMAWMKQTALGKNTAA